MRAMIFAAGLGTRLKPFTLSHPKALVEVGGVPMLQRVILRLRAAGIREMVVNVHHFADQIIDFLKANDNFGVDIKISDETNCLLDTGGGILAARQWLEGDDFIVHNADILTDMPIDAMFTAYKMSHADVSLLVDERDTSRYLFFDDDNRLRGWTNVRTGQVRPLILDTSWLKRRAFGGVHILGPAVWQPLADFAPKGKPFSIIDFYLENCDKLNICGYTPDKSYMWHDIGKPESLELAQADIIKH